jgi:hypothetical protein
MSSVLTIRSKTVSGVEFSCADQTQRKGEMTYGSQSFGSVEGITQGREGHDIERERRAFQYAILVLDAF